ncbi:MAG: MFS transporter, partial [Acidimicrobiales bacterium]
AVIFPTHNSLLADYYPVGARQRVYYTHRGGDSLGTLVGVLLGAGLADLFDWRAPFIVFAIPLVVAVLIGLRLREPLRGRHEQAALEQLMAEPDLAPGDRDSAKEVAQSTEEEQREHPPSFGEAWRMVWSIGALRRIFYALPLLAAALAGFASLASLQYQETFHLDVAERAYLTAPVQVFHVAGLIIGATLASRFARQGLRRVFNLLGVAALVASAFAVLFALAPNVPVAFIADAGIELSLAIVAPGVLASLSLAIPARARSIGFAIGSLFILPGLIVLPLVGAIGDRFGFRYGLLLTVPVFAVGGLIVSSAGGQIDRDVRNVWTSMRTRARMLAERRLGQLPLLAVRDLTVGYDGVTVVDGFHLEIAEGEIVALLGANGAGKSTILRAIGGVVEASGGAVVFDGRDITHMPPDEIARLGIAQVPGGAGVFPSLSVQENLRAAAWRSRGSDAEQQRVERALERFADLESRRSSRAGDLSGGQQQMLALAMALLTNPRLLLIDELSLGLAPIVVEGLLASVGSLRDRGTAVLLVEQSVDVAVAVADRGYVLESGKLRFAGTAQEIAARPDLLRSIYLRSAVSPGRTVLPAPETPASDTPALEVRDVSIAFGGITALDLVSVVVEPGEILGIIGPNGAGKTTLFDVVSGFERPSAGEVRLHGIDITDRTPALRARLRLGRLFQDSRLFKNLSVRDVLSVALERFIDVADPLNAMLRLPALQDAEAAVSHRVDELLAAFGLEPYAEHLV